MKEAVEVLVTLPFREDHLEKLAQVSSQLHLRQIRTWEQESIPADAWEKVDILYTDQILPLPEQAPALKWIQFHWAGISHAVQHPILNKPGLLVTTLSGAAASKVAEYTVLLMLALGNHLPAIMGNQKKSEWPTDRWERFKPIELRGKTAGIFGYGSIGRQLARVLSVFGMEILATKLHAMDPADHDYTPPNYGDPTGDLARRIYPPEALEWMVRESDFLVVSAPLTDRTRDCISDEIFSAMKPSAFLIDVSRGGIVDHQALVRALKDRKLAGAALDVFPKEPLPPDSPLWKLPNVIVSPHVAGITPNYDDRAVELFALNLQLFLDEQPLLNQYQPGRGY